MTTTILLTGFGPFPGAPFNPTGPLVAELAKHQHRDFPDVRRVAHVFPTSYQAVDQELPALLARQRPDVLVMFGLASGARRIRIETRARNALAPMTPDASGYFPAARRIARDAARSRPLPVPADRLLAAARSAGMPSVLSRSAGSYLCNYLCWRVSEQADGPRIPAFVHVPSVYEPGAQPPNRRWPNWLWSRLRPRFFSLDELVHGCEAIVLAALATSREAHSSINPLTD
jgi:pyroglutamyl-peptidase